MTEFTIRDSGARQEFAGGMVRDTTEGKTNYLSVRFGPMLRRWATHLTAGRAKYPDPEPGVPNWTLAEGVAEFLRAKESAARHFEQWLAGDRDEDHAAAVFFNINLAEYVLERSRGEMMIDPALGVAPDVIRDDPPPMTLDEGLDRMMDKPWRITNTFDPQLKRPFQVGDYVRDVRTGNPPARVVAVDPDGEWLKVEVPVEAWARVVPTAFAMLALEACNSNCLDCICPDTPDGGPTPDCYEPTKESHAHPRSWRAL